MRSVTPRPLLLVIAVALIVGAIAAVEARLGASGPVDAQAPAPAAENSERTPTANRASSSESDPDRQDGSSSASYGRTAPEKVGAAGTEERIERKEAEYARAEEISAPTGFINAAGVSLDEARGEKVVLVDFWTYTCYNCQNTQPYLNAWHEKYSDDGLLVVGVHTPEFGFERDRENVEAAVGEAGIEYPVVLDNGYATWNAYDNRYWPAMYLVDADGFVRYKHFGEGAYGQTEAKIRELLAEKNGTPS